MSSATTEGEEEQQRLPDVQQQERDDPSSPRSEGVGDDERGGGGEERGGGSSLHVLHCLKSVHKKPTSVLGSPSKMLSCLLTSAKALVLTVLSLLRKLLCFWRKPKGSGGFSEIDRGQFQRGPSDSDLTSWDSWGEDQGGGGGPSEIVISGGTSKPETVQDHIQAYRDSLQEARRQAAQRQDSAEREEQQQEQEQDLFAELQPEVRRQKKLYVGPRETRERKSSASRLGVQSETAMDPILAMGGELGEWGSGGAGGAWDDAAEDDEDLDDAIKRQKRTKRGRGGSSSYASSFSSN